MSDLPEYVNGVPNICGAEDQIESALRASAAEAGLSAGEPD